MMRNFKQNIMNSFRLAKNDIIQLQNNVLEMNKTQKKLVAEIEKLKGQVKAAKTKKVVTKTVAPKVIVKKAAPKRKRYVASKTGKLFHEEGSVFAQNIKPKFKVTFKSKTAALNAGYKPSRYVR